MSKLSIHASLVLLSLLSLSSVIAVDLFNQPTTYPNVCAGCWTSHTSTGKNGFQAFESFTLSSTQRISEVRWQGLYWDSIKAANNPVAPITTTWEISIWSDAAGAPGVQLHVETKPFADVSSILVGNTVMYNGDTVPVFDFAFRLATSFWASAETTYWVSPRSFGPASDAIFSWGSGTGGDGTTFQLAYPSGKTFIQSGDRALTLVESE